MNCVLRPERLVAFTFLILTVVGCGNRGQQTAKTGGPESKDDPIAKTLVRLERDDDAATCREVLVAINTYPSPRDPKPEPPLAELAPLLQLLKLSPGAAEKFAQSAFTPTDAEYLVDCFIVRDAVSSLDVASYPPREQAELAFAWLCRQVYVSQRSAFPAPTWWILQASSGSALDRTYAFLAILQQLGIDGCLLGPSELVSTPSIATDPKQKGQGVFAPIRAVGARIGPDIYLFDPVLGKPFTTGKGTATLAQVQADAAASKDMATIHGISADEVKNWRVFLAAPLPAFEPRMAWLERQFPSENSVRVAIDLLKAIERFKREGITCRVWVPSNDPFCLLNLANTFSQEVKAENGEMIRPMVGQFHGLHFPWKFVPVLRVDGVPLTGEPMRLIANMFESDFKNVLLTPNSARDQLVRGNFSNAIAALTDLKERNDLLRERANREPVTQADINNWANEANRYFAESVRAEERGDANALAQARADQMNFLRTKASERMATLVRQNTSKLLSGEAAYQLALIMHERAARATTRWQHDPTETRRSEAERLWRNADDAWRRFAVNHSELQNDFQERFTHAQQLHQSCRDEIDRVTKKQS